MKKDPYTKCGKCGDTVWQRNPYGQIHYEAFAPANPKTAAQTFVRENLKTVSPYWRTLTEDQRIAWRREAKHQKTRRRLGQSFPLNGFNYFIRVNLARLNRALPLLELPPGFYQQPDPALPVLSYLIFLEERGLRTPSALTLSKPAELPPPPGG